ncbi:relaxase/mobilization nuclease domain-containing protein [Hyphococcus luteus]|uniref:MobA/VirD2-like nuclease domain-containing protein n=1 Tax=Hyphococcus luteus TaxID=2058213 RepID=A0A2S7K0H3_9PROT|nr:relaxase/mobilization nuclease domain-containing protein [Marinicaulis flavus]PQA86023.1 hypothetical protein CW354_16720 [Marinicaulis flavus]
MVPKLHKKGSSFKGAARYLLHDKGRASSSDRVVWTQARNLAVHDPQMAWRIMAATAMDQSRLKAQAGIKATGRKSDKPVLHFTLSWHPEEKDRLTQEQMKRAASGAIKALGAQDHQALVIAHNDDDHPHVHILLNRVNPEDGRMLSSSKEKLNLSRWAEAYEKERGKIYCEERVHNNEKRDRGEYTRGTKDQHRRLFDEIEKGRKIANDNRTAIEELRNRQRAADALLSQKGRDLTRKHASEWRGFDQKFVSERQAAREHVEKSRARMLNTLHEAYQPQWEDLHKRQVRERKTFKLRETKLTGRFQNAIEAARQSFKHPNQETRAKLGEAFKAIAFKGARYQTLLRRHKAESHALRREQRTKERGIVRNMKEVHSLSKARASLDYLARRDRLIKAQEKERIALRLEWRQRHAERRRDWHDLSRKSVPKEKLKSDYTRAAEGFAPSTEEAKARIKRRLREARDKDKGRDGR